MALDTKHAGCVVEFSLTSLCTRHADQLQNLSHKVSILVSKGQNATMDIASVKRNL